MTSGAKTFLVAGALALLAPPQDPSDPAERAHDLVELLNSDSVEERDKASTALFKLGRPALPALEGAARGADPEAGARARLILTLIHWGVPPETPAPLLQTLSEIASQAPERKIALIKDLLKSKDATLRPLLDAIWKSLREPQVAAALAPWWTRRDTIATQERLQGLVSENAPVIHEALGDLYEYRLDPSRAADAYGRALRLHDTPDLYRKWRDAMVQSHRDAELADEIARGTHQENGRPLDRIAALYQCGRRPEADALVRECPQAAELACDYGSPQAVLGAESAQMSAHVRIHALALAGDFEHAEAEWRALPDDVHDRHLVLEGLLTARGDYDLATPGFLDEAIRHSPGEPHARLAKLLSSADPAAAMTEYKKAALLDPESAETFAALAEFAGAQGDRGRARQAWARAAALDPENPAYFQALSGLGPPDGATRAAGRGCWNGSLSVSRMGSLFSSPPVRLGAHVYYLDRLGYFIKAKDATDPVPVWTYQPPKQHRLSRRGWRYTWSLQNPKVAEWDGHLVAVFDVAANTSSQEGSGWAEGSLIAVLDPGTGKELWTRAVSGIQGGKIFPKEGVVAFASGGVALFDLARRDWRWGAGNQSLVQGTPWVEGPSVYVGFANGILCKLKAQDGTILWTKGKPGVSLGKIVLQREGEALLFGAAGRLTALGPQDGETIWEREWKPSRWGDSVTSEAGVLYGWGPYPASAWAVRLADGKTLWHRVITRESSWTQSGGLVAGGLFVIDNRGITLLDRKTGEIVLARPVENWPWQSSVFAEGDTLVVSTAIRPEYSYDPGPDEQSQFRRFDSEPARRLVYRFVMNPPSPWPAASRQAAQGAEGALRISLLEDACYGPSAQDPESWKALAEALMDLGEPLRAVDALRTGSLLSPGTIEGLKPWQDLAQAWMSRAGDETGRFQALIDEWEKTLKCLKLVADFTNPKTVAQEPAADDQFWSKSDDLLRHPSPATRVAVASFNAESGDAESFRTLVQAAPEVDGALALRGMARMIPRLLFLRHWSSQGWGTLDVDAVVEALADCSRRAQGDVRGAAIAAMELLGRRSPDPEAARLLEGVLASPDPVLQLAAGAALLARGDERAMGPLLKAIGSAEKRERTIAIWVAGQARCARATPALLGALKEQEDSNLRGLALEALIRIGTPEAQSALMEATHHLEWFQAGRVARALRLMGTPEALDRILELSRNPTSRYMAVSMYWELRGVDHPRARERLLEFGGEELAGAPDEGYFIMAVLRARLAGGRLPEAAADLERLVALWPPNAEVAQARFDLAAAQGREDEARKWRAEAERLLGQSQAVEPARVQHRYRAGLLYLHPASLADPARATKYLEEAAGLDPDDEDVTRALNEARAAAGGKGK